MASHPGPGSTPPGSRSTSSTATGSAATGTTASSHTRSSSAGVLSTEALPSPPGVAGPPRLPSIRGAAVAEAPPRVEPAGRRALSVGAVLAVVVLLVPPLRFVLGYLRILVHEAGHAATSWLFGYPSIPAFDFTYGGGVALSFDRQVPLLLLVAGFGAWLVWKAREHRPALALLASLLALYLLAALTPLHEALILALGHGAELLFAALALHRAATGSGCRAPAAERPLYGMVGWFLVVEGVLFSWGLLTDPGQQQLYADAKGGGHWMDFSRLALDYLGSDLELPAALFLVASLATPLAVAAGLVVHRRLGNGD